MDRHSPNAAIAARLAEFEANEWSGEVWRHTFANNPPERRNVRGARWNPPDLEALYVSLDRATAIAEADHLIAAQPLRPRATRTVHRLRISLGAVVDLTDPARLSSLGVDGSALASDDFVACQAVGAAAAFLRLDGIIVPSARSPGHNIVILFTGSESFAEVEVLDSELL